MKTDIAGSTPRFRALLAADLQALLLEHQAFVANHTAREGGQIIQPAGDGYWLEFPSVTGAARSAIAMQEALRLAQPNKGDDRLSMRIVIGVGDAAIQEGNLLGDVAPLIVRIEAITPPDEIFLTAAAHLALTRAEIQTVPAGTFSLKGFGEPVSVYRVQQRHRTHIIDEALILVSDLRGFRRFVETAPVDKVEHLLNALEAVTHGVADEFGGTIRYSSGDAYCVTFSNLEQLIAAAEHLRQNWEAADREGRFGCAITIALHRGRVCSFRSFLYGAGIVAAARVRKLGTGTLAVGEGGVFVTGAVLDQLSGSPRHNQLRPIPLNLLDERLSGLTVYRLQRGP